MITDSYSGGLCCSGQHFCEQSCLDLRGTGLTREIVYVWNSFRWFLIIWWLGHLWQILLWNSYCSGHDGICRTMTHLPQPQHSGGRNRKTLWILDQPGSHSEFQVSTALSAGPFSNHKQTTNMNSYFDFIFYFSLPEVRAKSMYVRGKDLAGSSGSLLVLICRNTKEYDRWWEDLGHLLE